MSVIAAKRNLYRSQNKYV